ncbi:MAG: PqqD family protein [Alphaproteobacteria bacterium]|nr:PqqD family protein [Alphaproteobacteria bacterium]MBU0798515.1 PqqD family protein [Alphaproteobacteria bacterium]MBU0886205.1 PqqD family protein [Alphaproteobacteria bacterium]MBU1812845.1 PqqD family protein [Alphaproteobacteria bacterium]MBU2090583.1 PqqD family protein [Alphaproteobacteria bacterium]
MLVKFAGILQPVAFIGCENLLPYVLKIIPSWPWDIATDQLEEPVIAIHRIDDGYVIHAPWHSQPMSDPTEVSAACSLIVDLIHARTLERSIEGEEFCLHGAAAVFSGRLVVFPALQRAGKSTLMARLAAAGQRIFADDLLGICTLEDIGISFGASPRLRLPLPTRTRRPFRNFIDAHRGPADDRYLYLDLPAAQLALHGETAPLGAIVLLDRRATGAAILVPARRSAGLRHLIVQNLTGHHDAETIVARLRRLVDELPCYTLRFSNIDEAAALLHDSFISWPSQSGEGETARIAAEEPSPLPSKSYLQPQMKSAAPRRRRRLDDDPYIRLPAVAAHEVDGEIFLTDPRDGAIHHLNLMASGLWRLLAEPITTKQAVEVVQTAFPSLQRQRLERDVTALFSHLLENKLIAHPEHLDSLAAAGARAPLGRTAKTAS